MVSMVETSISNHNDMAMDQVAPKSEPLNEGSISSAVSTPDPEGEVLTQDVAQTQKRKGGRKPVRKNHLHMGVDIPLYGSPLVYLFISSHSCYLSTPVLICWPYLFATFFFLSCCTLVGPGPRITPLYHLSFPLIILITLPIFSLFDLFCISLNSYSNVILSANA